MHWAAIVSCSQPTILSTGRAVNSSTLCRSTKLCARTSPTITRRGCSAFDALLRLDHAHGLAVEPSADVLDDVGEIFPVILFAHIAEMRRDHDIVHLSKRVIERQRFDVENVEPGAGD